MAILAKFSLAAMTVGVASIGVFAVPNDGGFFTARTAAKGDAMVTVQGAKAPIPQERMASANGVPDQSRLRSSSVVTHVEVIGGSEDAKIVLLDSNGNIVFKTDPTQNSTVVARDVIVPSVRVVRRW